MALPVCLIPVSSLKSFSFSRFGVSRSQLLITALVMSACSMANPAYASEFTYHFSGAGMEFGVPTSTEEKLVETAETMNHNRSKTAAYILSSKVSLASLYLRNLLAP